MRNRDYFNEHVKTILRDRVGGFCSNPNCRKPTTGPHTDPSKRTSIGEAAHITAASPGGPRYNPNLTDEQRSSANNGLWLCANCADLIDKDEASYPIEMLISWKMQAEAEQSNRLLNPSYQSRNTVINNANNVVINAVPNSNSSITLNLWRNLSENLEKYQHSLDYAYGVWEGNFKNKYPNIHKNDNRMFNLDYQDLQNEIDTFGGNLYGDQIENIRVNYSESNNALAEVVYKLSIEMSGRLYDLLSEYMNCMTFHYENDGGIGLVDYYWSSFFVCLDNNYGRMKQLKDRIDDLIREEYAAARDRE